MKHIPVLMKELRKSKFLSVEELAELSGLSRPTIFKIEAGDMGARLVTLEKIFTALDFPLWKVLMIEHLDEIALEVGKTVPKHFFKGG